MAKQRRAPGLKKFSVSHGAAKQEVKFKLDTGAQANILPVNIAQALGATIQRSSAKLIDYSGDVIRNHGHTILSEGSAPDGKPISFELADNDRCPLLGLSSCVELNLVRRVDSVKKRTSLLSLMSALVVLAVWIESMR
jgi:hypothetical protein